MRVAFYLTLFLIAQLSAFSQPTSDEIYFTIPPSKMKNLDGLSISMYVDNTDYKLLEPLDSLTKSDSLLLENYTPVNALDAISDMITDSTNVVIISEHHLINRSRAFIIEVAELLSKKGFDTAFLEALNYTDKELNDRQFPYTYSGFYAREPIASELIRSLYTNNYKLYPYEARDFQYAPSTRKVLKHFEEEKIKLKIEGKRINQKQYDLDENEAFLEMSARDYSQYKNIMQNLDTNKKNLIIVGHGHGNKITYGGWRALGYWLDRTKDVNLVSIRASEMIEQHLFLPSRILSVFDLETPSLLQKADSSYYNNKQYEPSIKKDVGGLIDANVFFPLNDFQRGEWESIGELKSKKKINISSYNFDVPFIFYSFLENELDSDYAVPTSINYCDQKLDNIEIFLREKGEKLFIWDGEKKIEIMH